MQTLFCLLVRHVAVNPAGPGWGEVDKAVISPVIPSFCTYLFMLSCRTGFNPQTQVYTLDTQLLWDKVSVYHNLFCFLSFGLLYIHRRG